MVKEVITYNLRYWKAIFTAFYLKKMVWKECTIRQVDEREWQINCFEMETGKTMVKESWINGKYAFLFAKGLYKVSEWFVRVYTSLN